MMHPGSLEEMEKHSILRECRRSAECGCPEEEWLMNGLDTIIHMEPATGGHIFIDCGDWEDERIVEASCIEDLRLQAKQWTFSIPVNNEL